MHNAVVLVDSRAAAMKESGDIILSKVGLQPSPAPANLLPSLCRRKSLLRLGRCSQSECMYHSHQERSLCSSPLVGGRPGGLPPDPSFARACVVPHPPSLPPSLPVQEWRLRTWPVPLLCFSATRRSSGSSGSQQARLEAHSASLGTRLCTFGQSGNKTMYTHSVFITFAD